MKKIVISGSTKLEDKVNYWIDYFTNEGYIILDHPRLKNPDDLPENYKNFYTALENTDVYFLLNEDKNGVRGYIGASATAEITYEVVQNLIHNKNIEIYLLNMPSKEVLSYDEIKFFLDMGWVKLFNQE
ncbi:MAG: hypothetical protein J1F35_03815 [Erysipelotrichales bacterium]|nr:hypothetical protein [Erysipelotrichales bacterium]